MYAQAASLVASLYNVPAVELAYIDSEGDEIPVTSYVEFQELLKFGKGCANGTIRLQVYERPLKQDMGLRHRRLGLVSPETSGTASGKTDRPTAEETNRETNRDLRFPISANEALVAVQFVSSLIEEAVEKTENDNATSEVLTELGLIARDVKHVCLTIQPFLEQPTYHKKLKAGFLLICDRVIDWLREHMGLSEDASDISEVLTEKEVETHNDDNSSKVDGQGDEAKPEEHEEEDGEEYRSRRNHDLLWLPQQEWSEPDMPPEHDVESLARFVEESSELLLADHERGPSVDTSVDEATENAGEASASSLVSKALGVLLRRSLRNETVVETLRRMNLVDPKEMSEGSNKGIGI